MLPAPITQRFVGSSHVQAFGTDHQPMKADESQTLGFYDGAVFPAVGGRYRGGIFGQSERGDLDPLIAGLADGATSVSEVELLERFIANGLMKIVTHVKSIQCRTGVPRCPMRRPQAPYFTCELPRSARVPARGAGRQ